MTALPQKFEQIILSLLPGEAGFFFEALQKSPVTSIRKNLHKPSAAFDTEEQVLWCAAGRNLQARPSFTLDPLFHAGAYYVQESSSMFLDAVVRSLPLGDAPLALDLCAAPGGKSSVLLDALPKGAFLVANEVIKTRTPVLIENLQRWGRANVLVCQNDPSRIGQMEETFDLIVVDAPCSGEGLWRRDPKAMEEWSEDAVNLCASRQERILEDILPALRPGGFLVYSTCTFNPKENEQQTAWLRDTCGMQPYPLDIPASWPVASENNWEFRFLPHKVSGEGLFMAVLRKPGELAPRPTPAEKKNQGGVRFEPIKEWLNNGENYAVIEEGEFLHALPAAWAGYYPKLRKALYVKYAGIVLGKTDKGGKLIPEHSLALATDIAADVPRYPLEREEALAFLRKDNLQLKQGFNTGWHLATYEGLPLGWLKILPNRINNYYPTGSRILQTD